MSDAEIWVMHKFFWIMFDWFGAFAFGIGSTLALFGIELFKPKKEWWLMVIKSLVITAIAFGSYLLFNYIRFAHIWEDIMINGNI